MNLYVSNLGFGVTDDGLTKLFSTYGAVKSAKVITDKFTQKSRGFGFVEMSDDTAASNAMKELNGTMVDGRAISVSEARPREERPNNRPSNKRW
jgi:RNA recognition motif-containing protein